MIVYTYDPITGEHLGQTEADENPLAPGEFLIPAFATPEQPMQPVEGHRAVFSSGVWTEIPLDFIAPQDEPLTLEKAKQTKKKLIEQDREGDLYNGFNFVLDPAISPMAVDTDPQSQANILLAAQLALLPGAPTSIDWRMKNNETVSLTASQVLSMAAQLGEHVRKAYARSWARKAALEAAQTVDAVLALP